jgi:protein TonB
MLNVLLESRAPRTLRTGGTLASTLVHAALVAGAVSLTVPPTVTATAPPQEIPIPTYPQPPVPEPHRPAGSSVATRPNVPSGPTLPRIDHVPTDVPPIDPGAIVAVPTHDDFGPGVGSATSPAGSGELGGPIGGPIDQRFVDRAPRLLPGSPEPRFPEALRARNQTGRVVVQLVVDTLGRAEQRDVKIVEATDAAFVDAVRAVLPRYRFTPGEAGGRKVRTVVQLPFDFALR